MKLNCDLGESYGAWQMGQDAKIIPLIDMASIACGAHAGDPVVIQSTLRTAKLHDVSVGAHPSYPDIQGFGRRSMRMPKEQLVALMHYQIAALEGMAKCQNMHLSYVKPHGALYNDMMAKSEVMFTMLSAISTYYCRYPLVIQATPQWHLHQAQAAELGVEIIFEAFADRCYQDDGKLLPRSQPGAVFEQEQMIEQASMLLSEAKVISNTGKRLSVKADTLCVHGDNQAALAGVEAIRQLIQGS